MHGFLYAELRRDALEGKHHPRPVVELGIHRPRAERTHVDRAVQLLQLPGNAPGQADHIGLAGIVARHIGPAGQQPRRGRHVQDGAAACRVHPAHRKAEQPRHGFHIHPDHFLFPGVVGLQIAAAHAKARVVDKDINGLPLQLLEKALAVLFLCKIGRQDTAGRAQFCGQRFQPVGAAGGQDEPAAQLCIAACKLLPDAGACASDPDGLLHGDFPFFSRPQSGGFLYLLPLF